MKSLWTRYSFCHLPFLLWFAFLMSDFLSVILRKGEGGAGTGSSVLIVKANISPSSPGERSMPPVSGDTAAFHSDVNQDKAKCFLQIHPGGQLADSPILFTLLFFCLFPGPWAYQTGLPGCGSVRGSASPAAWSSRSSGCGLPGAVGLRCSCPC